MKSQLVAKKKEDKKWPIEDGGWNVNHMGSRSTPDCQCLSLATVEILAYNSCQQAYDTFYIFHKNRARLYDCKERICQDSHNHKCLWLAMCLAHNQSCIPLSRQNLKIIASGIRKRKQTTTTIRIER